MFYYYNVIVHTQINNNLENYLVVIKYYNISYQKN